MIKLLDELYYTRKDYDHQSEPEVNMKMSTGLA